MKWTLVFAFTLAITAGCKKSSTPDDLVSTQSNGGSVTVKNNIVGTWRLVEYFEDKGDGTGHWVEATDADEISFTESGEVRYSSNSPLASRNVNRYTIIDGNHVELSSTASNYKEVYYYNRESDVYLVFNPQCRENCSRRYKLVD